MESSRGIHSVSFSEEAQGTLCGAQQAPDDESTGTTHPKPLSVPEYLESTVMTVLTEGLEDLCRQRPANPVDHLALFLLRHSHSSSATEVDRKSAVPVEPKKRDD
ncbi:Dpy 30 motif [Trypanosoma vivax]|uniref:Dpy-30 motif containing protein n=1 Tax=Trypanosoma vivax (strain Y486) TaxID=1055687 RepID=G0U007_TRYVY|nr:hypothetical protein TRVL_01133 [Trypanosoma vivax]KAH8614102.1 Dpy 30 motif [Trypanosoma vivax]CCC49403.1 conserved hypothetical protein [Trypanosoma vivax Y486]